MTDDPDNVISLFDGSGPPPPRHEDPRQEGTRAIVERLGSVMGTGTRTANLETGFKASAVDLGRLQDLLEQPLAKLEMDEVRTRWAELRGEAESTVLRWVQRVKELRFDVRATGVHVELQTQDDRGYYRYTFDIFPGR